jgi:hypothetical protein
MRYIEAGTGRHWVFVCDAQDAAGRRLVVLRGEDGAQIALDAQALPPHSNAPFTIAVSGTGGAEDIEALKETLQGIRHTSTIRFVAMPVFFAALGALVGAQIEHGTFRPHGLHVVALAGLMLSLFFCVFDIVLSRNLIRMWGAAKKLAARPPWEAVFAQRGRHDRRDVALWAVRITLFLPYAAGAAYWAWLLACGAPIAAFAGGLLPLMLALAIWWRAHPAA